MLASTLTLKGAQRGSEEAKVTACCVKCNVLIG